MGLLIAGSRGAFGQDIHFSQFFEAPLLRNPSLAGLFAGDLRFQGVYRTQWGSVTVPFQTFSCNGEYKMPIGAGDDFLTIGAQLSYDRAGTTNFTTTHIYPAINFHKSLSGYHNMYLSAGFMGGFVQRSIDRNKITTNNQWDGSGYNSSLDIGESLVDYNRRYADASAGLSFNTQLGESEYNNMFVGVGYHHFNRPKNAFYRDPTIELDAKWVYSLGVRFGITPNTYMTLQADHSRQGKYRETIGGAMVGFGLGGYDFNDAMYSVHFGGMIRWKDAVVPVVKIDYKPFSVAMSYDVNISQLKTASQGRGGFEISVNYVQFFDRYNSSRDAVRCPKF